MIQAIVDVGSNTVRMAIYNINSNNEIELLTKKKHLLGLASYVKDGAILQEGIDKLCSILQDFRSFLNMLHIETVVAFTTAALRNCTNSQDTVEEIRRKSGIKLDIVSGEEEAELGFIGVLNSSGITSGLLVDIGGASTEIIFGEEDRIIKKVSLPFGSLSYKTKFVKGTFPTLDEIDKMKQEISLVLHSMDGFEAIQADICGIGGSFKGAWALNNEIRKEKNQEEENTFSTDCLDEMVNRLMYTNFNNDDLILLLRAVPDRINTIIPGMVIAKEITTYFNSRFITYSNSGMREGFIYKNIIFKK